MLSKKLLKQRKKNFFQHMLPNSIAILPSAPVHKRTDQMVFNYRQDNDFYYLTGFEEPNSVAIFIKEKIKTQYILFNLPRDLQKERWTGCRVGQEDAIKTFQADLAYPISELDKRLSEFLQNKQQLYYAYGKNDAFDKKIFSLINEIRKNARKGIYAPETIINTDTILHEMRLIKTAFEIQLMKKAAAISKKAVDKAIKQCCSGKYEYELEAELLHEFKYHGAQDVAFHSIIASGNNACILHYEKNNAQLKNNDLVLIDTGCEYQYYASDISRTFPVSGQFSEPQRAVYELVLKTQKAVIKIIKPDIRWHKLQEKAVQVITKGLCELGILKGKVNDLIEHKTYKDFYMHHIGHWIGMSAHDVGAYKVNGKWRELKPGMVFTVEPGIYISSNIKGIDSKWLGIGVRIEDEVLVTETGCEILTKH